MPAIEQPVRKVHLIFKTHLDVGFTDLARVVAGYFDSYIRAIQVAQELRAAGGPERLVWTTGSWLIFEYLEQAAPAGAAAALETAIAAGDIAWHGLPCTFHSELLDPALFRFGLGLSQSLDQRFGRHTIAAKMTDVPGRGIVPLLAEAGIQFLHIGVNAASTPPAVPVFVWRARMAPDCRHVSQGARTGTSWSCLGWTRQSALPIRVTIWAQSAEEVRAALPMCRRNCPAPGSAASTMDAFAAALHSVVTRCRS